MRVSIPTEIGFLTKLQKFNCDYNKITTIPTEIGFLTKLKWLFIEDNKLSIIPFELNFLTLYLFKISRNPIKFPSPHRNEWELEELKEELHIQHDLFAKQL